MWKNCLESEITFWVLGIADVVMIGILIYGAVLWIKEENRIKAIMSERYGKIEKLENSKKK